MTPTKALTDLYQRLVKAEAELLTKAGDHKIPGEHARLRGKAEGIALARDYVRYTLALVENSPAAEIYKPDGGR